MKAKSLLPKTAYRKNAEIYKIMANPKRLEILNVLGKRELSVEDLVRVLKVPKANVSQHLAILRHNKLVRARRSGQSVYYKICDPRIIEPCKIFHNLSICK